MCWSVRDVTLSCKNTMSTLIKMQSLSLSLSLSLSIYLSFYLYIYTETDRYDYVN